jgi:hypothetical protein
MPTPPVGPELVEEKLPREVPWKKTGEGGANRGAAHTSLSGAEQTRDNYCSIVGHGR